VALQALVDDDVDLLQGDDLDSLRGVDARLPLPHFLGLPPLLAPLFWALVSLIFLISSSAVIPEYHGAQGCARSCASDLHGFRQQRPAHGVPSQSKGS